MVFLTHGALHRALTDGFVRLAVLRRAFKKRLSLQSQRKNFSRFAGRLLRLEWADRRSPGLLGELLDKPSGMPTTLAVRALSIPGVRRTSSRGARRANPSTSSHSKTSKAGVVPSAAMSSSPSQTAAETAVAV